MYLQKGSVFAVFSERPILKRVFLLSILAVSLFQTLSAAFADAWVHENVQDPVQGRGWFCTEYYEETGEQGGNVGDNGIICRPQDTNDTRRWQAMCVHAGNNPCFVCESPDLDIDTRSPENGGECTLQSQNVFGWDGIFPAIDREVYGISQEGSVTDESQVQEGGSVFNGVFQGVANWISGVTFETVSLLVWFLTEILLWILWALLALTGALFDFVVGEFVIEMGKYITAENAGAVREAWTIIRDLANIAIVGGLIATAIGTIVNSKNYNVQANLARLILAALLVNFSYFFAGAVIDVSNFIAKAAYENVICFPQDGEERCGIADRFGEAINFWGVRQLIGNAENQSLAELQQNQTTDYGEDTNGSTQGAVEEGGGEVRSSFDEGASPSRHATYNIFLLIFGCVTIFVFLSAISLLIGRFVVLVFLIVTSPIGIAGPAVPFLSKYAEQWWKALTSQSMFAPVYFILVGIALNILDALAGEVMQGSYEGWTATALTTSLTYVAQIATLFTIGIGFMWAALEAAKKMSAEGQEYFKPIYDGVQKYLTRPVAGFAAREVVGRGAMFLGQRMAGFSTRAGGIYGGLVDKYAPKKGVLKAIAGKDSAVDKLLRGMGRGADRMVQGRLDKTAEQKFFDTEGFKTLLDQKLARKAKLADKKKDLENQDQDDGTEARRHLKEKERDLKKELGIKNKKDKLAALRGITALEQAERDGTIDDAGRKRLASLRELADIEKFKAARKKHPKDGVTKDPHTGELLEGTRLAELEKERRELEAQGVTPANQARLDALNAEIEEQRDFERQKDKYGWGGAQGMIRRANSKVDRGVAAGEALTRVNEKARHEALEKINGDLTAGDVSTLRRLEEERALDPAAFDADPTKRAQLDGLEGRAYMNASEEEKYLEAAQTAPHLRTPAQKALLEATNRKMASFEKAERTHYRKMTKPLDAADRTKLTNFEAAKAAGKLTDAAQIAEYAELKERDRIEREGLNQQAAENNLHLRSRQLTRDDGMARNFVEEKDATTGEVTYTPEELSQHRYRLETSDATKQRRMVGDRERILGNFSEGYMMEEYRKDNNSIIKYGNGLTEDDFIKLMGNHEISEEVRNKMWSQRMKAYGEGVVNIVKKVKSGELVEGTDAHEEAMLDQYNWVTKHVGNKLFLEALKQDAVIGEIDGKEVRLKDLNTADFIKTTWNTSSSTAFADAKSAGTYGTNMMAEIAKAKRSGKDRTRDLVSAVFEAQEVGDDSNFLKEVGGTVQLDSHRRMDAAVGRILDPKGAIQQTIANYEAGGERRGNLTVEDYANALRYDRFAKLQRDAKAGRGPIAEIVKHGKTRTEIRTELAAKLGVDPSTISDAQADTLISLDAVARHKKGELRDAAGDVVPIEPEQQLVYEVEEELRQASIGWFEGKNEYEARGVLNKRSLHSPATAMGVRTNQIPALLDKQDSSEVAAFWENMLLYRDSKEVLGMLRNQSIGGTFVKPSPQRLQEINLIKIARGEEPIILPEE